MTLTPARLLLLALPVIGLVLLLAIPDLDVVWENHPAHFWLVIGVAFIASGLGILLGEAAGRRRDARVFLISLVFLSTFGFLALHALATPGVLLEKSNSGFQIASAVGLVVASGFAAVSALDLSDETAAAIIRRRRVFHVGLLTLLVAWAVFSLGDLPPLDGDLTVDDHRTTFGALAVLAGILYAFAAWRYYLRCRRRPSTLLLAIVVALVLLGEAIVAVAVARNWHATWWEWHLLMLVAFAVVAWSAWDEWKRERSELWSDLYEERTRGRREELSVLFADLMGFTLFSERTPEDEVRAMVNEYFQDVIPALEANGGEVVDTAGDAVLAMFRRPGHETRAARAGLDFQDSAGRVAARNPDWPRFRVGVNSGEVYLGLVQARGVRRIAPTGDCVNVTARLQSQARAGEVLIGERTRAALGENARAEDLGEIGVKGREQPVRAFVLLALSVRGSDGDQRLDEQEAEPER
jgi:adenylate cyclase